MDYLSRFQLTGATALVTGGARGLGKEMSIALLQAGASLVIGDVNQTLLEDTVQELSQYGTCAGITLDVTNEDSVAAAVEEAAGRFGQLNIIVNNAGIASRSKVEEMTIQEWRAIMDVNLTGVFLVSKHAGRRMIEQGTGGSIVNIASMSGMIVNTPMTQSAYNTSKAGVIMFTKSCAAEWAQHGIRVNAIAPGYMKTALIGTEFDPDGPFHQVLNLIPMKRLGQPHELGGLVIWLASGASSYVTGSVISIDGGYTVW